MIDLFEVGMFGVIAGIGFFGLFVLSDVVKKWFDNHVKENYPSPRPIENDGFISFTSIDHNHIQYKVRKSDIQAYSQSWDSDDPSLIGGCAIWVKGQEEPYFVKETKQEIDLIMEYN